MNNVANASYLPPIDAQSEIRLIRFQRTKTVDDIACEVTVHKLNEVQDRYNAISYTWGEATPTERITVNGVGVDVRCNCWNALRQVKNDKDYRDGRLRIRKKYVWIDSICIDQSNDLEKSCQVQLMTDIYSSAHTVLVCLNLLDDEHGAGAWGTLLSHSYFQRIWTFQECILAKKLHVLIGRRRRDMLSAFAMYRHAVTSQSADALCELLESVKSKDLRINGLDLVAMIIKHCGLRHCYNPRDMVYGFLGLVPIELRQRIGLDYSKTLAQVLFDYSCAYDLLDNSVVQHVLVGDAPTAQNVLIGNARLELGAIHGDLLQFWTGFDELFRIYDEADTGFFDSFIQIIQAALLHRGRPSTPIAPSRPITLNICNAAPYSFLSLSGEPYWGVLRIDNLHGQVLMTHTRLGPKKTLFLDFEGSQPDASERRTVPIDVPACVTDGDIILVVECCVKKHATFHDYSGLLVFRPPSSERGLWQLLGVAGLVATDECHALPGYQRGYRALRTLQSLQGLEMARLTIRLHPAVLVAAFLASMDSERSHFVGRDLPGLDFRGLPCEMINFPGIGSYPPVGHPHID